MNLHGGASTSRASVGRASRTGRWACAARRWLVAASLAGVGTAGCMTVPLPGPPPYRVVLAPGYDPAVQHRLLLMPLVGLGDPVAAEMITEVLFNELRTVGPFEVVMPEPKPCPACEPPPSPYPTEAELAELVAQYQPDAFVFVTVTSYSPYPPLELGLAVRVVGAFDRQTLASIDTTRLAVQDIPFSNGDCTFAHDADDLLLADAAVAGSSPRQFARHVSLHVAHALALDPLPVPPSGSGWLALPKPDPSRGWFGHWPKSHAVPQ